MLPAFLGLLWKILYIFDQYHAGTVVEGLVSVFNWYLRVGSVQCRCHLTTTGLYHHAGITMCVPVTSCGMVPVLVVALQPLECVLVVFTYQYLLGPLPFSRLVLVHLVLYQAIFLEFLFCQWISQFVCSKACCCPVYTSTLAYNV